MPLTLNGKSFGEFTDEHQVTAYLYKVIMKSDAGTSLVGNWGKLPIVAGKSEKFAHISVGETRMGTK